MNSFAERVRAARKEAKLNQQQLAKKAGLSQTTISDIERGRNEGSRDVVALAKALKVSAEWLMAGEAAKPDDAERQVMLEFVRVYRGTTDEGRHFLRNAIAAVESAFVKVGVEQKKRA